MLNQIDMDWTGINASLYRRGFASCGELLSVTDCHVLIYSYQVVIGFSSPTKDYEGGELMLVEQRPPKHRACPAFERGRGSGDYHALSPATGNAWVLPNQHVTRREGH